MRKRKEKQYFRHFVALEMIRVVQSIFLKLHKSSVAAIDAAAHSSSCCCYFCFLFLQNADVMLVEFGVGCVRRINHSYRGA